MDESELSNGFLRGSGAEMSPVQLTSEAAPAFLFSRYHVVVVCGATWFLEPHYFFL